MVSGAEARALGLDHRRLEVLRQFSLMVFESLDEFAGLWCVESVVVVELELSVQLNQRGAIRRNVLIH